jgi:hypothetical protein
MNRDAHGKLTNYYLLRMFCSVLYELEHLVCSSLFATLKFYLQNKHSGVLYECTESAHEANDPSARGKESCLQTFSSSSKFHPVCLVLSVRLPLHRDVVGSVSYSNHLSAAFITSISANMSSMLKFRYELHAASNGLTARSVMQRHKIIC